MNFQLPLLFESFDRQRARAVSIGADEPATEYVDIDGGSTGGTNYWTNDDPRPTKEEVLEKLEDVEHLFELVDFLVPEEIASNIPPWLRPPIEWAVPLAEVLVEIDPLDRIQD